MKIAFNQLEEKQLPNFKGGDGVFFAKMYDDARVKILQGKLVKGASIGLHQHMPSMEIIFILSGTGRALCDGKEEVLEAGDCHYCPMGSEHTLRNEQDEDLCFYAVVPQQ